MTIIALLCCKVHSIHTNLQILVVCAVLIVIERTVTEHNEPRLTSPVSGFQVRPQPHALHRRWTEIMLCADVGHVNIGHVMTVPEHAIAATRLRPG